ncbi:hypothetical protein OH77DRAFT_1077346 [Trametes cingulata]|nr:hypothetical protein OH77DRAFT_1077346 [Trametes cingulata]
MGIPIHAPIPMRPHRTHVSLEATVVSTSSGHRRKHRTPRDLTDATRRTLSLGVAAHRLYIESRLLALREENTQNAPTRASGNALATAESSGSAANPVTTPALRRSNAIRSTRRPNSPRGAFLRRSELTLEASFPTILTSPQPSFLGMIWLMIRPSVVVSIHGETVEIKTPKSESTVPFVASKRPALSRMNAVPSLRVFMDSSDCREMKGAPASRASIDAEVTILDVIPEILDGDMQAHSASTVTDTSSPCGSSTPSAMSDAGARVHSPKRRSLATMFKDYWLRTCRPRPAACGRPILPTIEEDSEYHVPPPLCRSFGHVMVRSKGKQAPRRPKTRRQSENAPPSSEASPTLPKARTARAASCYVPRGAPMISGTQGCA